MAALPAIGAAFGAAGALYQGQAAYQAGQYNAGMYRQNAQITRQSAVQQAKQQSRENYLRIGEMRAQIGASGGTGGSFVDVLADTAAQGELARQNILYAGEVKARNLEAGANLAEAEGKAARFGSYLQAGASLMTAGGGGLRGPSSTGPSINYSSYAG